MELFLVSVQASFTQNEQIYQTLRNEVENSRLGTCRRFEVPNNFKIGSLDSLVALADDLTKLDHHLESVLRKIDRQYQELEDHHEQLKVIIGHGEQSLHPIAYIQNFTWNVTKFPPSKTLQELSQLIKDRMQSLDNELKSRVSMFQEMKNTYSHLAKKEGGSLYNRDLNELFNQSGMISSEDFLATEHLISVLVVVPKKDVRRFIETYESLDSQVVPRTAKQLPVSDKDDLTLWRVVVWRTSLESFVHATRQQKWTVRQFEYNPQKYKEDKEHRDKLQVELMDQQRRVNLTCKSSFSEIFTCYIHLKAIRIFIESVLRYSLPPNFVSVSIEPGAGKEKRILDSLIGRFLKPGESRELYSTREEAEEGEDFLPFVMLRVPKL